MKNDAIIKFPGFPSNLEKDFWKYPRLLDKYWYILTGTEQKVLDFILRQTIGWKDQTSGRLKKSDKISLSQFQYGVRNLNRGTGLSKGSIIKGLKGLESKGFIQKDGSESIYGTNSYKLVVQKMDKGCANPEQENSARNEQLDSTRNEHTIENFNTEINREETIERIFNLFREKILPGTKKSENILNLISQRLMNFSEDQLLEAITRFSGNNWWMERTAYLGPAWFFKSDQNIEKFLNIRDGPEKLNPYREERYD